MNHKYSSQDLNKFIACKHNILLKIKGLGHTELADAHEQLIQETGLHHEALYLKYLQKAGHQIVEIPNKGSWNERASLTTKAMKEGAEYIAQAVLLKGQWCGITDLLKRVEQPSELGAYSYEAIEIKLARMPKPEHIIQLCLYSDLLEHHQGTRPTSFSVILGNNEEKIFEFSDFVHYYTIVKKSFEAYVDSNPTFPSPNAFCPRCEWHTLNNHDWLDGNHLSQVANIRASQILSLEEAGIQTIEQLACNNEEEDILHIKEPILSRLRVQAQLQHKKRKTGENQCKLLPIGEGKGFTRLPKPDLNDLFFDMEGDPFYPPDGLEYLFGFYYLINGKEAFKPFWAHNKAEEKIAFEQVIDFISNHLSQNPDAYIYHYNHYEATAIKRLASSYGTREAEVDDLLRNQKLVDLYPIVRNGIQTSTQGYSLKDLEIFYMEQRDNAVATAKDSVVMYHQWKETQDKALLKEISDYNEADCYSTYLLREWLLNLRPSSIKWFKPEDRNAVSDKAPTRSLKELEQEQRVAALLQSTTEADYKFKELVAALLGFYRREEKPEWWALFERQGKDYEDLLEDAECITGLVLHPQKTPFPDKRSTVYTYSFPTQDHKLSTGDQWSLITPIKSLGTVYETNDKESTISLKTTATLSSALSITLHPIVRTGSLKSALDRFADAVITKTNNYSAITAFLKRQNPRIRGLTPNTPIVADATSIEQICKSVARLHNSYLFIQGPPGSGKTYTSSRIIVDLLRQGKRIAISSNSHKAINNLLSKIEEMAKEQKISFRGQKKSSSDEDSFNGEMIADVFENKQIDPLRSQLVAGTAWLFAEETLDQKFDYIFVDEAGQVSLANFVVMSLSAKNIVLIGDQMQLNHPLKGTHPNESGVSALEYLLQGQATVPQNKGVFLNTSWRMHDKVCHFISDAVYNGRLCSEKDNQNQSLIFSKEAHPSLIRHGIQFIPVQHIGCSQKSEKEGAIIKELYFNLLEQKYRDRKSQIHPITSENILVIAPYNMQVNHLKSILPQEARVGTVDKFQGQEAEIVLISMTTSSHEDMPRNIEFLYNKQRLNVAISRARTLAVVIANQQLLEIPCIDIEQMRTVNTLCWAKEYADSFRPNYSTV